MKDKHLYLRLERPDTDWLSPIDILEKAAGGKLEIPPGYEIAEIIEEPSAPTDKEKEYRLILKPIAQ